MSTVNHELYAQARTEYEARFGKRYKKLRKEVKSIEPMLMLEELKSVKNEIKELKLRAKYLREKIKQFDLTNIKRSGYFKRDISIYVLKLEGDNWYIGMSRNVERRFSKHLDGKGANWTREHKPIEIHEVIDTKINLDSEASILEDKVTLEYAKKYGTQRVRGGGYCQTKPKWPNFLNN